MLMVPVARKVFYADYNIMVCFDSWEKVGICSEAVFKLLRVFMVVLITL